MSTGAAQSAPRLADLTPNLFRFQKFIVIEATNDVPMSYLL